MSSVAPVSNRAREAWSPPDSEQTHHDRASEHRPSSLTQGSTSSLQYSIPYPLQDQSPDQTQASLAPRNPRSVPVPEIQEDIDFGDYLTPDYSSDDHNPQPTPEIEDLVWQEKYNDQSASPLDQGNDPYVIDTSVDASDSLHSAVSTDSKLSSRHLPSPQLTATPPPLPESSSYSQQSSSLGNEFHQSPKAPPTQVKRSLASINTGSANQNHIDAGTLSARAMASQSVSPVIRVSSHTRGDSPARDQFGVSRSLSGRSQPRRASESNTRISPSEAEHRATLMPPTQQEDEDWEDEATERAGVAPNQRNTDTIASINDMEQQHQHNETMAGVANWLAGTDINDALPANSLDRPSRNWLRKDRFRSRSTGARVDAIGMPVFRDNHLPGPGALIDVESNWYYSDEESEPTESDAASEERPPTPPTEFPPIESIEEIAPDEDVPLQRQFIRRSPWQDPVRYQWPIADSRVQPESANAAMMLYERQAARFETASRAATWGTGRRASESEIGSIMNEGKTRHLSLSQRTRDRGASIMHSLNEARHKLLPRRSNSNIKKNATQSPAGAAEQRVSSPDAADNRNSTESAKPIRRPSMHKQKSPSTSSALLAIGGQLAAVGASGSGVNVETEPPRSPLLQKLKRVRSKSDVPKSPQPGSSGRPEPSPPQSAIPAPAIGSPSQELLFSDTAQHMSDVNRDVSMQGTGIRMNLPVCESNIIPNLEGFKTHARELNPRLPPYLIERIGQDQLRRYKKLVKSKVDHIQAVEAQNCPSGERCLSLGGEVKVLPPRTSAKDPSNNGAQFKVSNSGDSDADESAFDGIVTPALFPDGIPLPPTKRLPAEFECPLCFQVKSFQKPSDWTKHVHEDVQPFSCTFPNCPEPKSFKRKADWVRHENERHRHLEWWQCNLHECSHVCYRKDNFVQHLVREHKKKEPKVRSRGSNSSKAKAGGIGTNLANREEHEFWNLVDACRRESTTDPRQEPCKFCNNVCATWKKLSVHVGKHMEQIAMPVLDLAQARIVTKDTVISPIEPTLSRVPQSSGGDLAVGTEFNALSPYTMSGTSNYQSSSAGQSPSGMFSQGSSARPQRTTLNTNYAYYDRPFVTNGVQDTPVNASPYSAGQSFTSNPGFGGYTGFADHIQYSAYGAHPATYPPPQLLRGPQPQPQQQQQQHHQTVTPRSQPSDGGFPSVSMDSMSVRYYDGQQFYSSPQMEQPYMQGYGDNLMQGSAMMAGAGAAAMGQGEGPMRSAHGMTSEYQYGRRPGDTQQGYFG